MAYYEITAVVMFFVAIIGGAWLSLKIYTEVKGAYLEGFEAAEKLYYKEMRDEDESVARILEKENASKPRISPEILMAYGVGRIGDLPKHVLQSYNISEDQFGMDLEALIEDDKPEY